MEVIDAKSEILKIRHYIGYSQIGSHMSYVYTASQPITVRINSYHIPQT